MGDVPQLAMQAQYDKRCRRQDGKHRTSVPGVYSAGDVEGGYKQIVTASGQGAEAAMTIFEDMINPYWLDSKN